MAGANDRHNRGMGAPSDVASDATPKGTPKQKRMKFTTKQALVLTLSNADVSPDTPFAFYVDTDIEKIAFVNWFVQHFQSGGFRDFVNFEAHEVWSPEGKRAIYFEAIFGTEGQHDPTKQERLFPIASEGEKLALFSYVAAGDLDAILCPHGCGVHVKLVTAAVKLDAGGATLAIANKVPQAVAQEIVGQLLNADTEANAAQVAPDE